MDISKSRKQSKQQPSADFTPEDLGISTVDKAAAQRDEILEGIAQALVSKRQEAIEYRKNSGIEEIWLRAEEAYVGIDDFNRGQYVNARWAKPMIANAPLQRESGNDNRKRSTVYIRLTTKYVDCATAKVGEILLPADDKAFKLNATPIPDLLAMEGNNTPALLDGKPVMNGNVPSTLHEVSKDIIAKATDAAEKAETRIYDWMVEAKFAAETRKVIFDCARIGVGILKGPIPVSKREQAAITSPNGITLEIKESLVPGLTWVDPWNCFPDPACGENIHDGEMFFERDFLSPKGVRELKKLPGYIPEMIDKVLEEGPTSNYLTNINKPEKQEKKNRFEVWYFYGNLKKEEFLALNPSKDPKDLKDSIPAIVTLINDTPVKAALNPLAKSGSFPYNAIPWRRRPGNWAGIGIGEQLDVPQSMINGASRAMLNNAGKSAGSQIVVDRGIVEPADNDWTITPDKFWNVRPDAVTKSVKDAFDMFQIPNVTQQMMAIVEYAFRLAEESTNIPLVTQGISGTTQPDTLGGMQLQNNNANQLLRDVGYMFDDYLTEPLVTKFYEWLMLDPDIPAEEKGDFTIDAHGSIALVERAIQEQFLWQMGNLVLNPQSGLSFTKWISEVMRSKKLNVKSLEMDETEKQALAKQQPPVAPQVQVATINAEKDMKMQAAQIQADQAEAEKARQAEAVQAAQDRQLKLVIQHSAEFIEQMKQQGASAETVTQLKAMLADTAMKLQVQERENVRALAHERDLKTAEHVVDLHKNHTNQPIQPPVEPAGRAPDGQSFAQ